MTDVSVCIVGLGSRGLSVFERLLDKSSKHPENIRLNLHIVDDGDLGVGIHTSEQPDYILLNTVSSQLNVFPDRSTISEPVFCEGPGLLDWAREQGYKVGADGYTLTRAEGREISPFDYLPRRLLGEYLHWAYNRLLAHLPDNVTVHAHKDRAVNIRKEGEFELVELTGGEQVKVNAVFLTTGHTRNKERPAQKAV